MVRIRREPILALGVVQATIMAGDEFGLHLTRGQRTAIEGLLIAVAVFIGRKLVRPVFQNHRA